MTPKNYKLLVDKTYNCTHRKVGQENRQTTECRNLRGNDSSKAAAVLL